jgi:hypothetical protein
MAVLRFHRGTVGTGLLWAAHDERYVFHHVVLDVLEMVQHLG